MDKLKVEEKIKVFSEDELQEFLTKIFKRMGHSNVELNCGTQEYGKDIFFTEKGTIKDTNYACVVKINDINQSATAKVIEQVQTAFDIPANTKNGKIQIQNVIVVTNGVFKQNAKHIISESNMVKAKKGYINFWDINDVVKYSIEHIADLIEDKQSVHEVEFKKLLLPKLSIFENIRFLQTDFKIDIDRLDDLEIKFKTRYNSLKKEKSYYLGTANTIQSNESVSFNDEEQIFKTDNNYLITGIATSGKSSLLKRLGKKFIKLFEDNLLFYFELNKHVQMFKDRKIIDVIENSFTESVGFTFNVNKVKVEKSLLLLDGLDELADDEIRTEVINKIVEFKNDFPKCQVIITSRLIEFLVNNEIIEDNFEKYELLPLNIEEFIKIGETLITDESSVADYIKLVKRSGIINAFPKTPLTSILLAILFKEKQINISELPANITELYKKFIDLFLNRWDTSKGLSQQFRFQQKEFILQSIAKYMHGKNKLVIAHSELVDELKKLNEDTPIEDLKDIEKFICELEKTTNIISCSKGENEREYSFFHLTVQEYFASLRLKPSDEDMMLENFYNNWWLNPTIFYTGKDPNNSSFIQKLADNAIFPLDPASKIKFIINSSLILTAGHLVSKKVRKDLLSSMTTTFDLLIKQIIEHIDSEANHPLRSKTILDLTLDARNLFLQRFNISSFIPCLTEIWEEKIVKNPTQFGDIFRYCFAYLLSVRTKDKKFLFSFLDDKSLNVRWNKIVEVDVNVNHLNHKDYKDKIFIKIQNKAVKNSKYINEQFKQPMKKHLNALLDAHIEKK